MTDELLSEKEAKKMRMKEIQIEAALTNLKIEISEYDIKFGHSKGVPMPIIVLLSHVETQFQMLKQEVRQMPFAKLGDIDVHKLMDHVNKKAEEKRSDTPNKGK